MKLCRFVVLCSVVVFLMLTTLSADTIPGGDVAGTWYAANSPYYIAGNITIPSSDTLTIEPAVVVEFQGAYSLTVNGFLQAIGTEADSIHFTPVTTWSGLIFTNAPDSSRLAYCTVSGSIDWGGISCTGSNPIITHSTISNNQGLVWGGIFLQNSNPSISYCAIINNENYTDGGGIHIVGSSPQISYCSITGNYSHSRGGGIYCSTGAPIISGTSITGNRAGAVGGGIYVGGDQVTITDCIIAADTAYYQGGGIYIATSGGSLTLNNSTISNCFAQSGGGAYVAQAAIVSITEGTFESNAVANNGGGGAMWINQAGTVSMVRTTLDDNYCGFYPGGVIHSVNCSNLLIDQCDVVNNRAAVIESGIHLNGNTAMTVKNCIFSNQMGPDIWFESYTSASVLYNDFYDGSFIGGPPGLGLIDTVNANGDSCDVYYNIYLDPLFVDWWNRDYHLTEGSPCIDAGDPTSPYDPDSTITDMGRYFYDQRMPSIALSTTALDFGSMTMGQSVDLPFVIYNLGDGNLRISDISNNLAVFAHNWSPQDSIVLPGDSLEVLVTFTPDDTIMFNDTCWIDNNDSLCCVTLTGQGLPTGVAEGALAVPKAFALHQALPNPCRSFATIKFELPKAGALELTVYDVSGRLVSQLINGVYEAGSHEARFDASGLSAGVYFYRLKASGYTAIRKIIVTK
jgi:hypothetical protein